MNQTSAMAATPISNNYRVLFFRNQVERGTVAIYGLRYPLTALYMVLTALVIAGVSMNLDVSRQQPRQKGGDAMDIPGRDSLISIFWENKKLMFVYGSGDETAARQYRQILEGHAGSSEYMEIAVRSDVEWLADPAANWSLYLVGTPVSNRLIREMMPDLPFSIAGDSLFFNGKSYGNRPVLSLTFYPHPGKPSQPLSLLTGPRPEPIIEYLNNRRRRRFYPGGWGYEVIDGGKRVVMGHFDQRAGREWRPGGELHWDFSDPPRQYGQFDGFRMWVHDTGLPGRRLDSAGQHLEEQYQKVMEFFGGKQKAPSIDLHIFSTAEGKGLQTGNTRPTHVRDGAVYRSLAPEFQGFEDGEANRPILSALLGSPRVAVLETGLSIYLTEHWQQRGWDYWAALLHRSGNGMPIQELLDEDLVRVESPLVTGCMAAAWVDFFIKDMGKEAFLTAYPTLDPGTMRSRSMQKRFAAHLDRLVATHSSEFPERRNLAASLPPYQKGFNFAHEGYQIYNGYLSEAATRSLAYTADELHCNVTAIIPYSGMSDPRKPEYLHFSNGAGGENDESVVHCIRGAQQAGMRSLLKPQLWLHQSWPGSIEMGSEKDWEAFFGYYYRWMRHYALLGEIYGADALCVGVEFQEASLQRPDDWRQLIRRLRGIFSGPMTYAANWGKEFENLEFWDELDFIGLNCYYPLSDKEKATDKDLDRGFAAVMDKVGKVARRWDKQVVFTEIGFPSLRASWQEPYAESRDRPASVECQERCYRAMIRALEGREWCGGVYLWKWPAYPDSDGPRERARGFSPKDKPAEQLVKEWFGGV